MTRRNLFFVLAAVATLLLPATSSGAEEEPPYGSRENPIRCDGVEGEHAYLARLRDADGNPVKAVRIGAAIERSPHGQIMDMYGIEIPDGNRGKIYLDMYHKLYMSRRPIPGLRLLFEQDQQYEYIEARLHKLGDPKPFTGDIETRNKEGKVLASCRVAEGLIVGNQSYFYGNGKVQIEYPHDSGERHGVAKWFREDGRVWSEMPFVKGKLTGTMKIYDETNKLNTQVPYLDHQEDGQVKRFYPDGKLKELFEYKRGTLDGWHRKYDEEGKVTSETAYAKGQVKGTEQK